MNPVKIILTWAARIATWVLGLAVLTGGWAGYVPPRIWALPSMVCLVFPLLWLTLLAAGLLWFFWGRKLFTSIGCALILLATSGTFFTACPVRFPSSPEPGEKTLKVLTYNTLHCIDQEKPSLPYSRTLSYMLNSGADVICTQELFGLRGTTTRKRAHVTQAQIDSMNTLYPYRVVNHSLELNIYSKYPVTAYSDQFESRKSPAHYQLYTVDVGGRKVNFLNVHMSSYRLSSKEKSLTGGLRQDPLGTVRKDLGMRGSIYAKLRDAFIERADGARQMAALVKDIPGPLIMLGDFNDVPGSYMYRVLRNAGLEDAYTQVGRGLMYTFNANHFLFHIDQVLYRPDQGLTPVAMEKGTLKSSDHFPLLTTFVIN